METNQISNQSLTPQTTEKKRPTLVTILCILGFIALILSLTGSLTLLFLQDPEFPDIFRELPSWYPIFAMAINILYLAALVYIWKMKKMGLIAFTGLFAVNLIIAFAVAPSLIMSEALATFIIYVVVIGLFWTQHQKMS